MRKLLILLTLFIVSESRAQEDSTWVPMKPDRWHRGRLQPGGTRWIDDEYYFHYSRFLMVAGFEAGVTTASYITLNNVWYKDYPKEKFHFFDDSKEWMGMDKLGHITTSFTLARYGGSMMGWTGMKESKAVFFGGLTGFIYQGILEMFDAYSAGWGFSKADILANAGGYTLYTGQYLLWKELRLLPKFSFAPSGYAKYRPSLLGENTGEQIIKDYNGQIYWLSANIRSFMGHDSDFPRWLNIAVGYGANGMTGGKSNPPYFDPSTGNYLSFARYSQFYISPDIDLRGFIVRSKLLMRIFRTLDFIKIPMPGLMISNGKLSAQLISY